MQATGIIRRLDDLGRVVIPKEIRRQLKISDGDPLEIFLTKDGEIILKPYKVQEYTLRRGDMWEELIAPNGKVVCGNHRLYATEILDALGIQYSEEELEEDDQSSFFHFKTSAPRQRPSGAVFHYTTTPTNLSSEKRRKSCTKLFPEIWLKLLLDFFIKKCYYYYTRKGKKEPQKKTFEKKLKKGLTNKKPCGIIISVKGER